MLLKSSVGIRGARLRDVKCCAIQRLLLSRLLDKRRLHCFEPLLLKTPKIGKGLLNAKVQRGVWSASSLCASTPAPSLIT